MAKEQILQSAGDREPVLPSTTRNRKLSLVHWLIQSHGHCNFYFAQFKLAQYCFFRMGVQKKGHFECHSNWAPEQENHCSTSPSCGDAIIFRDGRQSIQHTKELCHVYFLLLGTEYCLRYAFQGVFHSSPRGTSICKWLRTSSGYLSTVEWPEESLNPILMLNGSLQLRNLFKRTMNSCVPRYP